MSSLCIFVLRCVMVVVVVVRCLVLVFLVDMVLR